jgi:MGT family glycosyltransferase
MQPVTSPRDFLFATWEGGGNVPPALTVAKKLAARGHRVRFMSDACGRREAEAVGAEFVPWRRAPSRPDRTAASDVLRDWEATSPEACIGRLFDRIMCGPALAYARDVAAEIDRRPPDLIVSSEMLFGVMVGAQARGMRLALLAANLSPYPLPGVPPFGAGLRPARDEAARRMHAEFGEASRAMCNAGLPAVNAARAALGLPPLAELHDQLAAADRLLLATSRAFDFEAERLPDNVRYVGPQLDEPVWAEPWVSPWPADDARPLVLVGFSTTFQDQAGTVQRVMDAMAGLPVRGLVTLGSALDGRGLSAPGNVVIQRSAPHGQVMREAAVVVTHAGHGTTMRALAHRVPLLCMPMGRDQNDNAARVVERGAGLELPPAASADEIREALHDLLNEPSFRTAARRLGDAVASEAAASSVIDELEACARAGAEEGWMNRPVAA